MYSLRASTRKSIALPGGCSSNNNNNKPNTRRKSVLSSPYKLENADTSETIIKPRLVSQEENGKYYFDFI